MRRFLCWLLGHEWHQKLIPVTREMIEPWYTGPISRPVCKRCGLDEWRPE